MNRIRIWWRQQNLKNWADRLASICLGLTLSLLYLGREVMSGIFFAGTILFAFIYFYKNWDRVPVSTIEEHPRMVEAGVKQVVTFLLPEPEDRYVLYTTDGIALQYLHKREIEELKKEYEKKNFGVVQVDSAITSEQIFIFYWKDHSVVEMRHENTNDCRLPNK